MKHQDNDVLTLLAEHGARFHALLYRLTLRTDVAEDLLQELFCKLSQSRGFQGANDPVAYAHRAATHLAFDWRRSQKRMRMVESNIDSFPASEISPVDALAYQEELDRVLDVIGCLSAQEQQIVVLRYLERQGYETIATALGKSTHQVRALCYKAIVRLRRLLRDESSPTRSTGRPVV